MTATRANRHSNSKAVLCDDDIDGLHARLSHGDTSAVDELARRFIDALPKHLRRRYRRAPIDLVTDACEDAILNYLARPHKYDPSFGVPLGTFLLLAADRNLRNLLEADRRRRSRETRYATQCNNYLTPANPFRIADPDVGSVQLVLSAIEPGPEREALIAWMRGERRTTAFALTLNLSHLPTSEQRREVKRFKDRMIKRLGRAFSKYRQD